MPVKFLLIAITLLFVELTAVFSQKNAYNFSKVDVENGLSNNQVYSIYRDNVGFVWFGTASGLNRFDGYNCKVFTNNPADTSSLNDNAVYDVFPLPDNRIWLGSEKNSSIYNPFTEKFDRNTKEYFKALSLPTTKLLNSQQDKKGNFWMLFEKDGIVKHAVSNGKNFHFITNDVQLSGKAITHFNQDSKGNFWLIYTDGTLVSIDGASLKTLRKFTGLTDFFKGKSFDWRLFVDKQDKLWVYSNAEAMGAFKVDPVDGNIRRFVTTDASYKLNDNLVRDIIQDDKGTIWIGTDHGGINLVEEADNSKIRYLLNKENDGKSLSYNSIEMLYKDKKGLIWAGTGKKGVSYINQNVTQFELYRHEANNSNSLPYNDITCFVEDKKGNVWIGANGGGLLYFNRTTNQFSQYLNKPGDPSSLCGNIVVSLCLDHEDKLWIGTYLNGLDVFDGKTFTHYRNNPDDPASVADNSIWSLYEDRAHEMWVGTIHGGINRFDRATEKFSHFYLDNQTAKPIHSNYIPVIKEDREGNLWFGTSEGIELLNKERNKFTNLAHNNDAASLSHQNTLDILEDSRNLVWVATRMGLNVYNKATKKFKRFSTDDGLPDNTILTLAEDKQGSLWITTPKGLCQLMVRQNTGDVLFSVRKFTETNNVQGKVFNENASMASSDGLIFEGGSTGFNIIDPKKIVASNTQPALVFTNIDIFNNEITVGQSVNKNVVLRNALPFANEITLSHNESIFSIEFTALDFSQNNQYAYKLEGFNQNWMYSNTDKPKITYTNLDPGTYHFKVKATNSDGVWGNNEKTLTIVIKPPFWRTPTAFVIYVLLLAGILYLARRYTLEKASMRFAVIEQRKESERVQALDAVKTKFFTNVSHEFRTPLSLILTPLDRIIKNSKDPDEKKQMVMVQRNAKRLLSLVNQLLDFRKMEVQEFKLQPTEGDIIKFIEDISQSFSDISEMKNIGLSFTSDTDRFITFFDKDKLEKILFNLLSNAFKYTPAKGQIAVHVFTEKENTINGQIKITVTDSGIGIPVEKQAQIFERFFQNDVPANITNPGTGIGLAITKEFVKLHNGSVGVKSEPDKGTIFTVSIPVQKINTQHTPAVSVTEIITPLRTEPLVAEKAEQSAKKTKPVILLVEDNDDFRFYLKDNLNHAYEVVETTNGQEAWEKLETLKPDLIVSDVMMPHMDGIELARRIKKKATLAAIPVILLTSVGDEEMQLESYRLGVSDYMTKPFTYEILASRIKNLLANAKLVNKKPQQLVEVNPTEIVVPAADDIFLKNVLEAIEKNIANPEYTVEELSKDLFMHRAGMYRKLLALTGISPLEFIRDIRLKRGKQLLEKSQMTISEIAYEVGFYNPKKFSQHFKEKYGITPSQFQKELMKPV